MSSNAGSVIGFFLVTGNVGGHTSPVDESSKDRLIRSRVEGERFERYEEACQAASRRAGYDICFSEWVRKACDRQAEEDLRSVR